MVYVDKITILRHLFFHDLVVIILIFVEIITILRYFLHIDQDADIAPLALPLLLKHHLLIPFLFDNDLVLGVEVGRVDVQVFADDHGTTTVYFVQELPDVLIYATVVLVQLQILLKNPLVLLWSTLSDFRIWVYLWLDYIVQHLTTLGVGITNQKQVVVANGRWRQNANFLVGALSNAVLNLLAKLVAARYFV